METTISVCFFKIIININYSKKSHAFFIEIPPVHLPPQFLELFQIVSSTFSGSEY